MNVQDLRRRISASKNVSLTGKKQVIETGSLVNFLGEQVEYSIELGLNINSAIACDQLWSCFISEMLDYIDNKNYSEEELSGVLSNLQVEDYHWSWVIKSKALSTAEYEWFFLFYDNKPQGACVIYHPKQSVLHSNNIFYVEFVAVAPWNRDNPYKPKMFKGVGTALIKCALNYAVNILGLHQGFSLHSLPQACDYYIKMGLVNCQNSNKDGLEYFEMPEDTAKQMLG